MRIGLQATHGVLQGLGSCSKNDVKIFTARKRSLGQGNIFIGVCQEFCSQGRGVCSGGCLLPGGLLWRVSATGGCLLPGGVSLGGCLLPGGVSAPRGCLLPGRAWSRPPQRILLRAVHILLKCILVITSY